MNERIRDLVYLCGKNAFFTRVPPTQEMLAIVEEELGFSLPDQFVEYLEELGYGGVGFEVLGVGYDGSLAFLGETIEYRESGLPSNLLVVENCGEWLYCIDVETGEVVTWFIGEEACVAYPSFDDYLESRLRDALENIEL